MTEVQVVKLSSLGKSPEKSKYAPYINAAKRMYDDEAVLVEVSGVNVSASVSMTMKRIAPNCGLRATMIAGKCYIVKSHPATKSL